jgi:hypothetical protein
VYAVALQPDGKIIIGGIFTFYNGTARNRLARLNANGSLDTSFNPGAGANNAVREIALQGDGKIIIGGEFFDYNNTLSPHIARVAGDLFVTWLAGDASNKTISLPITDDSILEPSETLTLTLVSLDGGAAVGPSPTATLTLIDNDTIIPAVSGSGVYKGTATLTATLASFGSNLSGKSISFTINNAPVGTAVTNSQGVATLAGVSLASFNAGAYADVVRAVFAGDADYSGSSGTGPLTVNKATPIISWNKPSNIIVGTALSSAQLNATANVAGTFQYNPTAGTVLGLGTHPLSVIFTPTDTANYNAVTRSVLLTVDPPPTPTLRLNQSTYSLVEGSGSIGIVVTRTGNPNVAVSVNYATSDTAALQNCNVFNNKASSRCDYVSVVGTLRFSAGQTSKTIFLPVVDDTYAEGTESLTITLSNPTGGAVLGAPFTATINITDNGNDNPTSTNPIDQTGFFVRQHYIDFLGREPDPPGFTAWSNQINNCVPSRPECDRLSVSQGIYLSPEFRDRGYFIYKFYAVALGRKPSYAEFVLDRARVSGFQSDAQLEQSKQDFIADFVTRPSFRTIYDSQTTARSYVETMLARGGLLLPVATRENIIARLGSGAITRAQALREIAESGEANARYINEATIVMHYFGYLRRDPDSFYQDWINILTSTGDSRNVTNGFVNSAEYRMRFGH